MKFVAFVVTEGAMPAEAIAEMNRDWPAHAEEMERRGGWRLGRELDLPEDGVATVRVRGGETLVTDGPFAETKEFIAGFELFESADLDEAVEAESTNPVLRFNPFEIRPLPEAFRLGQGVSAFADQDDAGGIPYLLTVWADEASARQVGDAELAQECDAWRNQVERFVLGGAVGGPRTARTLRTSDGKLDVTPGPFLDIPEFIAGIEVVRAPDLPAAVQLAARHPLARHHAIEVRPFYTGTA